MANNLKGKVALVTGGSRGLGAVIAEALAAEGADVAITYVASGDKAEAVVARLKQKGVRALALRILGRYAGSKAADHAQLVAPLARLKRRLVAKL